MNISEIRRRAALALVFALGFPVTERAVAAPTAHEPVAAVFLDDSPGAKPELGREIAGDVRAAGYAIQFIGPPVLTNSPALLARQFDFLVLPGARTLPLASMGPVRDYLRGGGKMMAFGLPAWESGAFVLQGKTFSKQEYQNLLDQQKPDHAIIDFAGENLSLWRRGVEGAETKTRWETTQNNGQPALHVIIDNLGGWNVLDSPPLRDPFPDGRTLTCFQAHGANGTRAMSVEWDEQDGSRWIATIDLSPEWKSYSLPPERFHFWESVAGRGGDGDHFNPQKAARLSVGLARSHCGFSGAHHEYWIGNVGSAHSPFAGLPPPDAMQAPPLDTLSPGWKFYPMRGPLKIGVPDGTALISPALVVWPETGGPLPQAMQPRPRGIGFDQDRPWRWQPLLEARSPQGDYRGAMATLLIHTGDEFRGGIWACFTPDDVAFYRQKEIKPLLRQTAAAIRRGLFLQEGGGEFFTVFDGQTFKIGARVVNLGGADQPRTTVEITVKPKNGGRNLFARSWPLSLAAGASQSVGQSWCPARWPDGGLIISVKLRAGGRLIDRLEHELNVWRPAPRPDYVQETNGGFTWRGRPWKANGVNYMPATGIGLSSGDYFEQWLGRGAYDPEAIERDLRRIKAMNLNAVSIFIYHSSMRAQHLLDFLRRCDNLGLHVNQSLRPGTPLDFLWDQMKELIEYYHLAENDTVFAYDLAWEAEHHDEQNSYGRDWTDWVIRRHGNAARAADAWGVPAPEVVAGILAVPSSRELTRDGPWRKRVADYRAFLDWELAKKYGEARRLIRSIDPHHAVSFRMSEAGDPTLNFENRLPYDFYGLKDAVDIFEPEAYGRIGDWNRVRAGKFEVNYARLCNPALPVVWAEMGYSVWEPRTRGESPEKLEFAAAFYRDFYRLMTESGCNGVFFWWYPGGLRVDEQSDFGIINPDGTDRAETGVIREAGSAFLQAPPAPAPRLFHPDRPGQGCARPVRNLRRSQNELLASHRRWKNSGIAMGK
jgi:hypothetical protein